MIKMTHQLPPQRNNDTVEKVDKWRENTNKEFNVSITSTKKKIGIEKREITNIPGKSGTSKNKKNDTVEKSDNQGLLQ